MVEKKCSDCKRVKLIEEFSWKNKERGTRQSKCKGCHRDYRRKNYLANTKHYGKLAKDRSLEARERAQKFVWNYLKKNPCADCGESDPLVLEFDHLEDKIKNLSYMIRNSWSIETIENEIKKCDVVCPNCHAKRTYKRGNFWRYKLWQEERI